MVQLTTIDTNRGKVSFLFGMRALSVFSRIAGTKTMREFGEKMTDPGFDDIALLLFAAHENYCKDQKKDLVYTDTDDTFSLIDEVGWDKAIDLMANGVTQLMGEGGSKKKAAKKT